MHPLGSERQMDLPSAAEFAEALENPAGDFLDTTIRIKAQTNLPIPDIADRHGNSKFPSAGLRSCSIQHP